MGECLWSLSLFMKPLRVTGKGTRNPHRLLTPAVVFNLFVLGASANAHPGLCPALCSASPALLMLPEGLSEVTLPLLPLCRAFRAVTLGLCEWY